MADLSGVLADLHDESAELDALVSGLPDERWTTETPATGWTIAHQVAHLAWTDEIAVQAVTDPDAFAMELASAATGADDFADAAARARVAAGTTSELLASWRRFRGDLADALRAVPDGERITWFGPPMSPTSMATARLMETWAHGQDVADALGVLRLPTARLRHIAHLGVRTRDFAHLVRGVPPPGDPFRVELIGPGGDLWAWGPNDAAQHVVGPALDFCLLVTQRRNRADLALVAHGPEADAWLDIAQAFAGPPGSGREAR